jgi:hypothetical protein
MPDQNRKPIGITQGIISKRLNNIRHRKSFQMDRENPLERLTMKEKSQDNILKLAASFTMPDWMKNLPQNGGPLDVAGKVIRNLSALDGDLAESLSDAASDPDLSSSGIGKKQKSVANEKLAKLKTIKAETEGVISKAIEKGRNDAKAKSETTPDAKLAAILRAQETRRYLFESIGDDNLLLGNVIRDASEHGDIETLDAILGAPASWPLVNTYDRQAVKSTRDEMEELSLGSETVQLIQAEKDITNRIEWVTERISEVTDKRDEIAELASGNE